jgi:hypothetical protein
MYFLEQLVAEWYSYKGYFVRTNVKFGKRAAGGYEGEIDVAAFDPKQKHLIHIEVSSDSNSWSERKERLTKKFSNASKHYKEVFNFPYDLIDRRAIVGFSRNTTSSIEFGGGIKVILIPEFFKNVTLSLKGITPMKSAVPEVYPLLRAIQFAVAYGM